MAAVARLLCKGVAGIDARSQMLPYALFLVLEGCCVGEDLGHYKGTGDWPRLGCFGCPSYCSRYEKACLRCNFKKCDEACSGGVSHDIQ